jgi:hypothetical protein
MTDALEQYRYEVKFVCPPEARDRFDLWLRYTPETFSHSYRDRVVNNIYFDTLGMRDFANNVIGVSGRLKTRLRWYGDTAAPTRMVLEQKIKSGRINRKHSLPLPGLDLSTTTWGELAELLIGHAEHRICVAASYFKNAVLRNCYLRQYYVSRGHRVRMTVDADLTYYDAAATAIVVGRDMGLKSTRQVVEFKSTVDRAWDLERLLQRIPLRLSRNSKYVVGVDQLRLRGAANFIGQKRPSKSTEASTAEVAVPAPGPPQADISPGR